MISHNKYGDQSGSAIIWILIAVALFAALNFAFNSGSRTSTSLLTGESTKAQAYAAQEYTNTVNIAVKRLKLRGCDDSEISYETPNGNNANPSAPTDEHCHVFKMAGGQVMFQGNDSVAPPPSLPTCGAMTTTNLQCSGIVLALDDPSANENVCQTFCEAQSGATCCWHSMIEGKCRATDGATFSVPGPFGDSSRSANCS